MARNIRPIQPYVAVSSLDEIRAQPERQSFKLDWNEATVPPSPAVTKALQSYLSDCNQLNFYPELRSASLCVKLAEKHNLSADNFLVTNGSDDALNTICATFLDPRDEVLIVAPTYQHFEVFVQTRGSARRLRNVGRSAPRSELHLVGPRKWHRWCSGHHRFHW